MNTNDLKLCIIALEHLHDEIEGSACEQGSEVSREQLVARIDVTLAHVRQTAGEWEEEDSKESYYKQKNTIKDNKKKRED